MNELVKKIFEIAENSAPEFGLFLIDIHLRGNDRNRIVEIYVDGEKNVSAENLAELSRVINDQIEVNNIIEGSYRLDVSTPGVERPLKFLKQFPKHINRKFDVQYNSGKEEVKIKAKLDSVEADNLIFTTEKTLIRINFKDIISAKVLISFS
jgi:ribosome maturation factor RimP